VRILAGRNSLVDPAIFFHRGNRDRIAYIVGATPIARLSTRRGTEWWVNLGLIGLLVLLSLPDLLSPPISPTIWRQTQTYAQTTHFVESGFSLHGLTIDIDGPRPLAAVYEFPLYHASVGTLFVFLGPAYFWGKLVSLAAMAASLLLFLRLARDEWGSAVAARAGFFFASSPITLLTSTAFQPDALALALNAAAIAALVRWRQNPALWRWLTFLGIMLASALAKFPVLVPFLPLFAAGTLRIGGRWRVPTIAEALATLAIFVVPFVAWSLYRTTLMESTSLVLNSTMFFFGDLSRFLDASFYMRPVFILGAMVMCGVGIPLALVGLRGLDAVGRLLVAGALFYFVLFPTAAFQTYYALPLVPLLALVMARGMLRLEPLGPARVRAVVMVCWVAGFCVAAPYTLRHDDVSFAAARAAAEVSQPDDLIFVMNMHDRGVSIGGLNTSIVTLAGRRGWNVDFDTTDANALRAQIEERRAQGARWIVATWFSEDLDPWFTPLLPAQFSRIPTFKGRPVDGRGITDRLSQHYPAVARGANFAILQLK
jgi:hypothetical protein